MEALAPVLYLLAATLMFGIILGILIGRRP